MSRFLVKVGGGSAVMMTGVTRWPNQVVAETGSAGQALAVLKSTHGLVVCKGLTGEVVLEAELYQEVAQEAEAAASSKVNTAAVQKALAESAPVSHEGYPAPPSYAEVLQTGYSPTVAQMIVVEEQAKAAAGYKPYGPHDPPVLTHGTGEVEQAPPAVEPPVSLPPASVEPPAPAPPPPTVVEVKTPRALKPGEAFPAPGMAMKVMVQWAADHSIPESELGADDRESKADRYAWLKAQFGV